MCYFRNDKLAVATDNFRLESFFNPRRKDAIIETYLCCFEKRLLDVQIALKRYYNLTKDQRDALYSLNDDPSIIIKGTGKGSVVAVWDREDYFKEAYKQLDARKMYEEVPNDLNALINTIMKAQTLSIRHSQICQVLSFTENS